MTKEQIMKQLDELVDGYLEDFDDGNYGEVSSTAEFIQVVWVESFLKAQSPEQIAPLEEQYKALPDIDIALAQQDIDHLLGGN